MNKDVTRDKKLEAIYYATNKGIDIEDFFANFKEALFENLDMELLEKNYNFIMGEDKNELS